VRSDFAVLVLIGILVGLGSGLAGIALHLGIRYFSVGAFGTSGTVLGIFLPALGAGLSWHVLNRVTHYEGRGIADVIWSAHREGGRMPKEAMFSQMAGVMLTVGTGGSAGPEGPVAFSGAAIGSNLGSFLGLTERRRITLLGCGVAGATAAIFNAPVTGLMFALEVVLGTWFSIHILPIALSSVTANVLAKSVLHDSQIFQVGSFEMHNLDLLACVGLAVLVGLGSVGLQRTMRLTRNAIVRIPVSGWIKAVTGGLLVGLIGFFLVEIPGASYGAIQDAFKGASEHGLWVILLLVLAKMLATGLTLGSGGCGGVFAPSLFIGAFLGLFYHAVLVATGLASPLSGAGGYALIGMAGMVGGTLQAPLTAIFLVAEITASYETLLPLILVSALAALVTRYFEPVIYYHRELESHGGSRAIRLDSLILADLSLCELLEQPAILLSEEQHVSAVRSEILESDADLFPVLARDGRYAGMARSLYLLGHEAEVSDYLLVADVMDSRWPRLRPDDDVGELLRILDEEHVLAVPVLDNEDRFQGLVSVDRLLRRYRQELLIQTQR
ncbi:MAG: chloride channel protein, partial [Planctomycetota bacterium]